MHCDFLNELNEAQKAAVTHTDGPVMVIAGAGSGKTRVLTYRIAYLLSLGVDPFNILALTFTNKASREMKQRILKLVGGRDAINVWAGTFHSIFAKILRKEGHKLGFPSDFSIYDTEDSKRLLKQIIKENNLDDKIYQPNTVLHRISMAKSSLLSPQAYNASAEIIAQDRAANKPFLGQIFNIYNNRLYKASAMDFDDLLFNMYVLLRDNPETLYKYQQKFKYILVDEYQDTNYVQYMIVKALAANNENICVVGDDAQSIYAFRGANIQNILNLKSDYPELAVYKLEQNYRSTQTIVDAANSIIANNKDQIFKKIWTDNSEGEKIKLFAANSENEEGQLIAHSIFEYKMNHQLNNSDFAVLYRTNAQSRALEEALRRLNIPYKIYGGISFYTRKEIKDLLAYFKLTVNHNDEEALMRVINYPARGIGKTTIEKVIIAGNENQKSIWDVVAHSTEYIKDLNAASHARLREFARMILSFDALQTKMNAFELANYIATSSGLMKELSSDKTSEGISRYENMEELLNAIKEFSMSESTEGEAIESKTLGAFMQEVALLTDADEGNKEHLDAVSLMTIHAAKGLEFPIVFIAGVEENLFPYYLSLSSRSELEEERRLFYVAVTRAMKKLFISYTSYRYKWGDIISCDPSRFIDEIDDNYLDYPQKSNPKPLPKQTKFEAQPNNLQTQHRKLTKISENKGVHQFENLSKENSLSQEIAVGTFVEHAKFGKGEVILMEGESDNLKATVNFKNFGEKQLLLKFAKLKILN